MRLLYTRIILSFALGLVCISASLAQSGDPVEEIKACARMTDSDVRFTCYENLGKRVLGDESTDEESIATPAAVAPVASAPPATEPSQSLAPMPDNLGSGKFSDQPDPATERYTGFVTSCQKGSDGFWYFRFDNGQVWKYVNIVKAKLGDCSFNATITVERMGHKMQIEGDDSKRRVTRKR